MKKVFFKITGLLNTGLIFGTIGGLASIAIIKLTHSGSYAMYLPSLFCIIISIYKVKLARPDHKYLRLLSTALLTASVTAFVSYMYLAFINLLPPVLIFFYLMRLGEILCIGVICCALLALKRTMKIK